MTTTNNTGLRLSIEKSQTLKGIALLLLLCHHLFYIQNGMYDDIYIHGHGLVHYIGIACKACVPMFVFLSGYGLTAVSQRMESINWKQFYIHRFSKLYLNYWLIWLLFVPVGVLYFGRSFDSVYGESGAGYFVADFLGLLNIFGKLGYNPTWWFYSCIIVLYILFPFILSAVKKPLTFWVLIAVSLGIVFLPIVYIQPIRFYLISYVLGCLFCNELIFKLIPPPHCENSPIGC